MRKTNFLPVLLLGVALMISCTKDPIIDDQQGVAPKLPAMETFIMPFTGFESADTTNLKGGSGARNMATHFHWFHAASNIVVWNAILTINMAIPVASFVEAFRHEAEFQGNGIWLWAYDYTIGGATYDAELSGKFINESEVQWEMSVSQKGGFSKVLFYSGVVSTDGKRGSWTLNYQPNNPTPYLSMEYNRDDVTGLATIRYTNIIPGSADKGDYIEYREDANSGVEFNRAYDVYRVAEDNLLEIKWNDLDKDGRVKNPALFKDGEWRCWDGNFVDIDC